jgi:cytochrome bd ubiquinol oxidase subunit II
MPSPEDVQTLEFALGFILLLGVILYAVLGGADFGGGIWDLLARGPRAKQQRDVIAHAIGPIWEANHVWLIFVIVIVFTVFPPVYAVLSVALFVPLTLALVGIVFRGVAFVFRTPARSVAVIGGVWDRVFAIASVVTPVFFGMAAGTVASGRIRVVDGAVQSDPWSTWLAPFPLVTGLLALTTCAFLAAVYLTVETTGELQEDFRRRALGAGAAFAILAAIALPLARRDAPQIWQGLTGTRAIIVVPIGILLALVTGWAVYNRRFLLARYTAVAEVILLLVGWALAQYPFLVAPDLTFENSAATPAMLRAALITYGLGAVILVPSLWLLFRVFKADLPGAVEVATPGAGGEVGPDRNATG